MDKDGTAFGVRTSCRNRIIREQDDVLAGFGPLETMTAGSAIRGIDYDYSVVGPILSRSLSSRLRNRSWESYESKF